MQTGAQYSSLIVIVIIISVIVIIVAIITHHCCYHHSSLSAPVNNPNNPDIKSRASTFHSTGVTIYKLSGEDFLNLMEQKLKNNKYVEQRS